MSESNLESAVLSERYASILAALCAIAEEHRRMGRIDSGLRLLAEGERIAADPEAPQPALLALLLQQGKLLADKGFYANSAYATAHAVLSRAHDMAVEARDEASLSSALHLLGQVRYNETMHTAAGEYDGALQLLQQALARRETQGDLRGRCESLFYIGLVYERWRQKDTARSYYQQAQAIAREHDYPIELSYAARHLAGLHEEDGDLDSALALFRESLALREAAGYRLLLPLSHIALGDVLGAMGDGTQALAQYERAYVLAQQMETPLAVMFSQLSLGVAYQRGQEWAIASQWFAEAYASAKAIHMAYGMATALEGLAQLVTHERATIAQ